MGSMKDLPGGNPSTIGDSRRMGITQFDVRCPPPCGHVATVKFDALRLPDTTIFHDIPKRRRLRCQECGRVATAIKANWAEHVAVGNGERPKEGWVVVARGPDGVEVRSSAVVSRGTALGLAFDMADAGDTILRLEGPVGDVTAEEIQKERTGRL